MNKYLSLLLLPQLIEITQKLGMIRMKLLYLSPDLISPRDLRHLILLDLFLELSDLVPRADLHLGEVPSQVPTEVTHRRIQPTLLLLQLVGQADVQTG